MDTDARLTARRAYFALEPIAISAYFGPGLPAAEEETGLDRLSMYFGGRGGPLGPCHHSVVAAAFFNYNPEAVEYCWGTAKKFGLDALAAVRNETIRALFSDIFPPDDLPSLTSRLREIGHGLPFGGRPLASAWANVEPTGEPYADFYQAVATLREWRGDGHVCALVVAELDRVQALALHEADHPDPEIRRRTLGVKFVKASRGWSDQRWDEAVDGLIDRGLLVRAESKAGVAMTAAGGQLYDALEDQTDAAASTAWQGVADADAVISQVKEISRAIAAAGFLPGTRRTGTSR